MQHILKILKGTLFIFIHTTLTLVLYFLIRRYLPEVIFGTWVSYVVIGFFFTILEGLFGLTLGIIGKICSIFYRPTLVKVICSIIILICFISSTVFIWNFISALFYAGLWEYFWGFFLTIAIFCLYGEFAIATLFYTSTTKLN